MTVTVLPSDGAHGHQSQRRSSDTETPEPARPPKSQRSGAVRILRTPQELSEAITRAQEFERRNDEVMRTRSQRYRDALGGPHPAANRVISGKGTTSEAGPAE
jgi:hypothetical protein